MMSKITFFEVEKWEIAYLKKKFKGHTLKFFEEPINDKNITQAKNSDVISVFIYSKLNKETIKKFTKLKLIATCSTGFDHIDLAECKKRKIIVSNVPSYGENTVAEHTFALILSLSRNIHKSYVRTQKNNFSIDGLMGFDLKGKTMGIIGGGHIGLHLARMAKGFGMKVLVFDIYKQAFLAEVIGFEYTAFDELLKNSDIISLNVPYNKHTHHLINKKNINKIKAGAVLVNTSRGAVIDTDALFQALKTKKLRGAGLDVVEGEELIKEEHQLLHNSTNSKKWETIVRNHKLFKLDNVVFTPHIAFNSKEAIYRILDTTADNIISGLKKNYINVVNN